ncbi:hypothetical protein HPB50_028982 [Hyalomma asiaticum]|nr:hypothetical protein HPB50_028982 [Hyalomma asiaticum]
MCVQRISAQCVLQFTPSLAAGCVLHRPENRVIHRLESYNQRFLDTVVRWRARDPGKNHRARNARVCPRKTHPLFSLHGGARDHFRRAGAADEVYSVEGRKDEASKGLAASAFE